MGSMVGSGLSMVSGISGDNMQQMADIEGAEMNAYIQRQSLKFQDKILDDQIGRLRPYWKEGKSAIKGLRSMDNAYGSGSSPADSSQGTRATLDAVSAFIEGEEGKRSGGFGANIDARLNRDAKITGRDVERRRLSDIAGAGMGAANATGALTPDQSTGIMNIGLGEARSRQISDIRAQNTVTRAMDSGSGAHAYMQDARATRQKNQYDPITTQSMKLGGF